DRHRRVVVSSRCRKALAICRTPWFLAASGTMGIVSRCVVVTTDASTKGWGAVCEGRGVNGLWSVTEAASHINVLELQTGVLALQHFLPRLSGQHVLVRTDNTATLAYINRQGGVRSPSLHHWATRLLLWAARHVLSLRAVNIPGHLHYGADLLSRGDPRAADWCLHPQVIGQIWVRFFKAQVDLFANRPPNAGAQDGVAPPSGVVASQSLAPERCRLIASGLSDAVVATIQSARALATRALYTLKWRSFEQWCAALGVILEFLQ